MTFRRIPLLPSLAGMAAQLHSTSGLAETWAADAFVRLLTLRGVAGQIMTVEDTPAALILWRVILDEAEILTIAVSQDHRRKGLGRVMIEDMFVAMRNEGADSVFLEVAVDNEPALSLYENMGFRKTGRRKGYYQTGFMQTDALIFFKRLQNKCRKLE